MSKVDLLVKRSIGKKQISAITSLLLAAFAVVHLGENYLLLYGKEPFTDWVDFLLSLRFVLVLMEIGLALSFGLHAYFGIRLWHENRRARTTPYQHPHRSGALQGARGAATPASLTMAVTGTLFVVFLVVHLINFKYTYSLGEQDLYDIVVDHFAHPGWAFFYVFSVSMLGIHLSHGLQSACQTLGLAHARYTPAIQRGSTAFGVLVAAGYSFLPLFILFTHR